MTGTSDHKDTRLQYSDFQNKSNRQNKVLWKIDIDWKQLILKPDKWFTWEK